MANKVYDYYKDLPAWAKGVVIVGGVAIVAYAGIKLSKVLFPSEQKKREKELEKDVNEEIKQAEQQGKKPTYTDSSYLQYANTIHNAMQFCVGDDYATVVNTAKKMMNDLDVAKLIKAYGNRQRYCFGIPAGGKDDLFTAIRAELGQEYAGITNYRVNQINSDWQSKGIKYQI
jgi:hypothetical protein